MVDEVFEAPLVHRVAAVRRNSDHCLSHSWLATLPLGSYRDRRRNWSMFQSGVGSITSSDDFRTDERAACAVDAAADYNGSGNPSQRWFANRCSLQNRPAPPTVRGTITSGSAVAELWNPECDRRGPQQSGRRRAPEARLRCSHHSPMELGNRPLAQSIEGQEERTSAPEQALSNPGCGMRRPWK